MDRFPKRRSTLAITVRTPFAKRVALVFCSLAILTKRPGFWCGGMGVCLVGLILVGLGYLSH